MSLNPRLCKLNIEALRRILSPLQVQPTSLSPSNSTSIGRRFQLPIKRSCVTFLQCLEPTLQSLSQNNSLPFSSSSLTFPVLNISTSVWIHIRSPKNGSCAHIVPFRPPTMPEDSRVAHANVPFQHADLLYMCCNLRSPSPLPSASASAMSSPSSLTQHGSSHCHSYVLLLNAGGESHVT